MRQEVLTHCTRFGGVACRQRSLQIGSRRKRKKHTRAETETAAGGVVVGLIGSDGGVTTASACEVGWWRGARRRHGAEGSQS